MFNFHLIAMLLLAAQASEASTPKGGFRKTPPCNLTAYRYADSLPGLYTYLVNLTGDCRGIAVSVQFQSKIGGVYPPQARTLNSARSYWVHTGNPEWWYPVKITPSGPVKITVVKVEEAQE